MCINTITSMQGSAVHFTCLKHGMDAVISLRQISTSLVLTILLVPYAVIATEHERVVQRPHSMRCPDAANSAGSLEGVSLLTARDPFTKRSETTPQYLSDRTLQLWQDLGRIHHPTVADPAVDNSFPVRPSRHSTNPPFFQGFRPSSPDLPTETYSPPLRRAVKGTRKKDLADFEFGKRGNNVIFSQVSDIGINRFNSKRRSVKLQSRREDNKGESRTVHYPAIFDPLTDVETFFRKSRQGPSRQLEPYSNVLALPWSCQTERFWVDLGANVFPRYVSDTRCVNATCWYGHYQCTSHRIEIPVLVHHYGACVDTRLPENIRSEYMLSTVEVRGTCICGRG